MGIQRGWNSVAGWNSSNVRRESGGGPVGFHRWLGLSWSSSAHSGGCNHLLMPLGRDHRNVLRYHPNMYVCAMHCVVVSRPSRSTSSSSRRTKDAWNNCTVCETQVACGADSALPNLVDGTLRMLPRNASKCMLSGQSFSGYYRSWPGVEPQNPPNALGGTVEVHLASSIEQALPLHKLQRVLAPFILGTGGLAVLVSLAYFVYVCCSRAWVQDDRPEVSYADCCGPSPTWRSEYAMVKGGTSSKAADDADICCVCLSARCGEVHFVECGHAVVCLTCSSLLRHCPVCSHPIDGIHIDQNVLL